MWQLARSFIGKSDEFQSLVFLDRGMRLHNIEPEALIEITCGR
jgi:hypothetical protein